LLFYWVFEGFLPGNPQKLIIFVRNSEKSSGTPRNRRKLREIVKRTFLSPKEENFREKKLSFSKNTEGFHMVSGPVWKNCHMVVSLAYLIPKVATLHVLRGGMA
jgi:hypothetical protein